jgi:pimeloyl-ACP methyl ester carboxylesterase/nucleoside-diphosphate-sugar epimerase
MKIDAFVTGGTGLLGRWVVNALAARGRNVGVLVRGSKERGADLVAWLGARGADVSRVALLEGELTRDGLGLSALDARSLAHVRDVFHTGGAMRFDMPRAEAFAVNVDGTKRVLDVAARSDALERVVVIGGFRLGHGAPGAKRGAYEASKIAAEELAIETAGRRGFRLSRVQPGSIIGDSRTGETTQLFGFAELVRDLWLGRVPALPGGSRHWMPLVTVDHLARFVAQLPEIDPLLADGEHVVLDDRTPNLEELLERLARHMGVAAVRRHVPKGALQLFLRAGGSKLVGAPAESLDFLAADRYDVAHAKQAARAMSLDEPEIVSSALRTAEFLLSVAFDPRPRREPPQMDRRARMEQVAGARTFVRGSASSPTVMLHGLPLDADVWDDLAAKIGADDALRPDLPGLGRSAGEGSAPVDFMRSLLADGAPRTIIAHSLGTRFAVEYAAAHPDRVRALVLIAPYFAQRPPPAPLRSRAVASLALSLAPVSKVLPPRGLDDGARARLGLALTRKGARARVGRALAAAHGVRASLVEMVARVRDAGVPVLVIVGAEDPLVVDLQGVAVRVIDGTGHFPQLDVPDRVAELVSENLNGVDVDDDADALRLLRGAAGDRDRGAAKGGAIVRPHHHAEAETVS